MDCGKYIGLLGLLISLNHEASAVSMSTIYSFFGKYGHESTCIKEYPVKQPLTFTVHNQEGSIKVKNTWKQNKVYVTAIKKSSSQEFLPEITIDEQLTSKENASSLTLTTKYRSTATKGCVEYILIIPENATLHLVNNNGDIMVQETLQPLTATTQCGNICVTNTRNIVTAHAQEKGSIIIERAHGNVRAMTGNGDITIHDASNSVIASTQKGSIYTTASHVSPTSRIILSADAGNIELGMPALVNATIQGKTERGCVKSDHYITLKPRMTKLNNEVWSQFKREVDGTIGTGEAEIKLTSKSGTIKITEVTA
jgi:hypothetical protein